MTRSSQTPPDLTPPGAGSRPKLPRWKLPRPVPPGLARRVPPALFPALLGLAGLALAWRRGIAQFALPPGLADLLAGAVTLLLAFALAALGLKIARRPAVLLEDLSILPGRAGIAAAVLAGYLLAALIGPLWPVLGKMLWALALVAQIAVMALSARILWQAPEAQRQVSPAWHLSFAGPLVGAMVAQLLGLHLAAAILFWPAALAALVIWGLSAARVSRALPPAPLRPLLAVHLAPVALIGMVSAGFGWAGMAQICAVLGVAGAALLAARGRWLLAGGFSPFWGALTFPAAALSALFLALDWRILGGLALIAATLIVLPIALRICKMWVNGSLATKSNAATA